MIKVEFLGPIGKAPIEIEAKTLADVSAKLKEDKTVSPWLSKCAVAVNDTMVKDLDFALKKRGQGIDPPSGMRRLKFGITKL